MYAEFILTIVALQVADCIKICLIRLDIVQWYLIPIPLYGYCIHNLGTI